MKYYYYVKEEQQFGPFTLEEIQAQKIKKSTLIWADGMEDWAAAETVEELKDFLVSAPPPIPKKTQPEIKEEAKKSTKYVLSYKKETNASLVGWILFSIPIIVALIRLAAIENNFNNIESFAFICVGTTIGWLFLLIPTFISIALFWGSDISAEIVFGIISGSLILRYIISQWIVKIAFRQNRDSFNWGFFAFISPMLSLIIIGILKKLRFNIDMIIENDLSALLEKANKYYSFYMYYECIEVLNKAENKHPQKFSSYGLRGCAYYYLENYEKAKIDFNKIINTEDKYTAIAELFMGNIAFKEHDKEKAIQYWLKAKEKNNQAAINNLKKYHDYTHKYFLSKAELLEKLGDTEYVDYAQAIYMGNLFLADNKQNLQNSDVEIQEHKNGLCLKFRKTFSASYIAVAFYEIESCTYCTDTNQFAVFLTDKNSLTLDYSSSPHFCLQKLEKIRDRIEKENSNK